MALDDRMGVGRRPEEEVAALFRAEYRPLVRLAVLLVGDRGTGEELVQDAFVKLQRSWGKVNDPDKAPAWLRSTVLNGARSQLRRRAVRRRHAAEEPGSGRSSAGAGAGVGAHQPDADAVAAEDRRRMLAALRTLPLRQREALVLKFYLDLSEAETAAAMGVSAGSVKTHVHRGLANLEAALKESDA